MTNVRSFAISATAALLLVAGSACSDNSSDPPNASPSSTGPSTPSTTASPSESELAGQRAESIVRDYFAEVDRLRQHPDLPLRGLKQVAISSELAAQLQLLRRERDEQRRQVGDTELLKVTVQSVNLENSDPQSGQVPTVQVDVCWDVTSVDILDASGQSVVSSSRPNRGWLRLTVANYQWASDKAGGWRVASSQDLKKTPCDAS